jgi:hypothetical protein
MELSDAICVISVQYINMASYTTAANGQVILTSGAPLHIPAAQTIQGGIIEAAGAKTIASQAAAADHYQNMGAGQKGAGRRRSRKTKHKGKRKGKKSRKVRRGGAQSLNMVPLGLPTANSVPGVNADDVLKGSVDLKNQIVADKSYDHLRGATPITVGGFRFRDAEELYPGSGSQEDTKGQSKVKHGRRSKRTHRRGNRKSSHRRSRKRSRV